MDGTATTDSQTEHTPPNRIVPTDMVVVAVFIVIADILLLTLGGDMVALRALFGLPILLFVPGYVLLAVLFPRRDSTDGTETDRKEDPLAFGQSRAERPDGPSGSRTITWGERVVLSFGTSVALIPLFGLSFYRVTPSFSTETILSGLTVFVTLGIIAGTWRRSRLPEDEQFRVPYQRWETVFREGVLDNDNSIDRALNVLLLLSIFTAMATMGFALLVPHNAETYSTFAVLAEGENGDLVASGYPTEFVQGESEQLTLLVKNKEGVETTYTVVAEVQRVDTGGDSTAVVEKEEVLRERETVAAGETWTAAHEIAPTITGENLRLKYYLYTGDTPREASSENAYRELHLWITVSGSDE